jgi:hypothetical protein
MAKDSVFMLITGRSRRYPTRFSMLRLRNNERCTIHALARPVLGSTSILSLLPIRGSGGTWLAGIGVGMTMACSTSGRARNSATIAGRSVPGGK